MIVGTKMATKERKEDNDDLSNVNEFATWRYFQISIFHFSKA